MSSVRSASSIVTPGHVVPGPLSGLPTGSVTASSYTITPAPSIHTPVTRESDVYLATKVKLLAFREKVNIISYGLKALCSRGREKVKMVLRHYLRGRK